jgi:hypothetical protein
MPMAVVFGWTIRYFGLTLTLNGSELPLFRNCRPRRRPRISNRIVSAQ